MICIMESHTRCATNRSQPHQSLIKKTAAANPQRGQKRETCYSGKGD
jgi:hypothetical protein